MYNSTIPDDEIALYTLSLQNTEFNVVYTRSTVWSTVATSKPMTYAEICDAGDIHLVYFGKGTFTELMNNPSSQMPTVHLPHRESVYHRR